LHSQRSDFCQIVPADVEGTDANDLAIPNGDKEISEMVIELAKGTRENIPSIGIEFDQPLNLLHIFEFGFSDHLILSRES
jgi:hypothetical protein